MECSLPIIGGIYSLSGEIKSRVHEILRDSGGSGGQHQLYWLSLEIILLRPYNNLKHVLLNIPFFFCREIFVP